MPYRNGGDTRITAADLVSAALGPAVEYALGTFPSDRLRDSGVALAVRLGSADIAAPAEPG